MRKYTTVDFLDLNKADNNIIILTSTQRDGLLGENQEICQRWEQGYKPLEIHRRWQQAIINEVKLIILPLIISFIIIVMVQR